MGRIVSGLAAFILAIFVVAALACGLTHETASPSSATTGQRGEAASGAHAFAGPPPTAGGRRCDFNTSCPEHLRCVDDPTDTCAGTGCPGFCRPVTPAGPFTCDYSDPNRLYISRDSTECTTLSFTCPSDKPSVFSDLCGCGCEVFNP